VAADLAVPSPDDRRFTDQEVAQVLQRATEIEERRATTSPATGLSLAELRDIAREVGLSPDVIDEAVGALQARGRTPGASVLGAPLSSKVVRGVPGQLSEQSLQGLIRLLEDRVEATGTVSEALGTVRWTSTGRGHKFDRTTQVSFHSKSDETQIQVVQRYPSGLRMVLHALPALWGGMIGGGVAASAGGISTATAMGIALASVGLGLGIGRSIWTGLARRNAREVERVAEELVSSARGATEN
jgi:hypothetical protein